MVVYICRFLYRRLRGLLSVFHRRGIHEALEFCQLLTLFRAGEPELELELSRDSRGHLVGLTVGSFIAFVAQSPLYLPYTVAALAAHRIPGRSCEASLAVWVLVQKPF